MRPLAGDVVTVATTDHQMLRGLLVKKEDGSLWLGQTLVVDPYGLLSRYVEHVIVDRCERQIKCKITQRLTDPSDWRVGDHAVVTWPDGSRAAGKLHDTYGSLALDKSGVIVRLGTGAYTDGDRTIVVTREEPPEPTELGSVFKDRIGDAWVRADTDKEPWYRVGSSSVDWSSWSNIPK